MTPYELILSESISPHIKYMRKYGVYTLHVHSVNYAAKPVHTRLALSSTMINSHQETVSGRACTPLSPLILFFFLWWRSCTVPATKVAPFP